jgi:L-alanine-DL-glutamate epimerase-like enolase superfamily enzyme
MNTHARDRKRADATISDVRAHAFSIPTDAPEGDGTFRWDLTTLVVVEIEAADVVGLGYSYTSAAAAPMILQTLAPIARGADAFDVQRLWCALQRAVRNIGRDGLAATAISAVDTAAWDLKGKLLDLSLTRLWGSVRDRVEIYGSGGFTTYSDAQLSAQMRGFVEHDGCRCAKMKIGADPIRDPHRIQVAVDTLRGAQLMVDANGALGVKPALELAEAHLAELEVCWFEEPVSSDDLDGLSRIRSRAPAGMEIAAGEYGYDLDYFRRMLDAGAVDVLQADVTRCGGYTAFFAVAALCEAHHIDLSGHCAPALHLPVAAATPRLRHLEWFHDHVRIEHMLFDGAPVARDGVIQADPSRAGHGLVFKFKDAERYRVA